MAEYYQGGSDAPLTARDPLSDRDVPTQHCVFTWVTSGSAVAILIAKAGVPSAGGHVMDDGEATMSWAIWITGLPGSGKSVLARAAAETLRARGVPVKIL